MTRFMGVGGVLGGLFTQLFTLSTNRPIEASLTNLEDLLVTVENTLVKSFDPTSKKSSCSNYRCLLINFFWLIPWSALSQLLMVYTSVWDRFSTGCPSRHSPPKLCTRLGTSTQSALVCAASVAGDFCEHFRGSKSCPGTL